MIVALALSPSLDITYQVSRLHAHDITHPSAISRVAGGKALNLARVASGLNSRVHAVVALGGHQGNWVAEMLAGDNIPCTVVPLRRSTRSCISIVEASGGDSSTDLYEPATPVDRDEWEAFAPAALQAPVSVGVGAEPTRFVFSGSLPAGVQPSALADLLERLRKRGAWVAVDSSGAGLLACAPHCDLVKINRAEAIALLRGDAADSAAAALSVRSAALAIAERFGAEVIVTDGVRGGFAVFAGRETALAPPANRGRFPAGSGDAFLAGLLVGLNRGGSIDEVLQLANNAAERNAAVPGQGILAPG